MRIDLRFHLALMAILWHCRFASGISLDASRSESPAFIHS